MLSRLQVWLTNQPLIKYLTNSLSGVILFILIGYFAFFLFSIRVTAPDRDCGFNDDADIEAAAHLEIPDAAADVQALCDVVENKFRTRGVCVSFQLPPDDLDAFLATTKITEPLSSEPHYEYSPCSPKRLVWSDTLTFYGEIGVLGKDEDGILITKTSYQEILVDAADPALYVVYIYSLDP